MDNLIVYQTLHGYSNGHCLLATSISLSEQAKRKMAILSDLSGSEIQTGFKKYYTAYNLHEDNMAVLSCTWYADEMERPGCVWTHSLLIDIDNLYNFRKCTRTLINLFRKPVDLFELTQYTIPIKLNCANEDISLKIDSAKKSYLIWAIWGNKSPSIIVSENSNEFSDELIYLWISQYKDLEPNFSFSTGSMSLRSYDSEILKLQIAPQKIANTLKKTKGDCKILYDYLEIKRYPLWVAKANIYQDNDCWDDFNKFRFKFDDKYAAYDFLIPFLKIYISAKIETGKISVVAGIKVIMQIFDDTTKISIGMEFIDLYLTRALLEWDTIGNAIDLLKYLLENNWFALTFRQFEELIDLGLVEDELGSKKIINYLAQSPKSENNNLITLVYANKITIDQFEFFTDLDLESCLKLITHNLLFAQLGSIWKQSEELQREVIDVIKKEKNEKLKSINIAYSILDNSFFDFSEDIYYIYGEESVNVFLDYLLKNRLLVSNYISDLKKICRRHSEICMRRMKKDINILSSDQLLVFTELIDSYTITNNGSYKEYWIIMFDKVSETGADKNRLSIALFYLPIVLQSKDIFPAHIAIFVFETIHSALEVQKLSDSEWNKIDYILPQLGIIDLWDRCKRLRRAFKNKGYSLNRNNKGDDLDIHLL